VRNRPPRDSREETALTRLFLVAGARPNFMKIAPLFRRLTAIGGLDVRIVHTGQHYDRAMSDIFFEQLGLPEPHVTLSVGSASHGAQTGRVIERFESALNEHRPAAVVVVGDVNSTLACAIASVKIEYQDGTRPILAHVEAGLRSRDRSMPEEVNRVLTDAVSDLLFTSEEGARDNLVREGIDGTRIHFVGNVMIDCLIDAWPAIEGRREWTALGLQRKSYGLVTLHRPSNVDRPDALAALVSGLEEIARRVPLLFPVHPRTRERLRDAGLCEDSSIRLLDPLGYIEFISLLSGARIVLTDSGGLQEESTFLDVPCLTMRDNTERPVTITHGTNRLAGSRPEKLAAMAFDAISRPSADTGGPPLWDGRASERIASVLRSVLVEHEEHAGLSRLRI
jgi:UDP-N-acetylglucosamine 2-epimerase (non-hydrolysing)